MFSCLIVSTVSIQKTLLSISYIILIPSLWQGNMCPCKWQVHPSIFTYLWQCSALQWSAGALTGNTASMVEWKTLANKQQAQHVQSDSPQLSLVLSQLRCPKHNFDTHLQETPPVATLIETYEYLQLSDKWWWGGSTCKERDTVQQVHPGVLAK